MRRELDDGMQLPQRLARFNRHVTNPIQRMWAGWAQSFGILEHVAQHRAHRGIDLVGVQIELARGRTLREIGLEQDAVPAPRGTAVQLRINMEKIEADGTIKPAGGTLGTFLPPSGPGVRVDTYGYEGYTTNPAFDPLLAKLIVHGPDYEAAMSRAARALNEFAQGRDQTLAQLAVSWVLRDQRITSALVGASSAEQLRSNVAALSAPPLTDQEIATLDQWAVDGTGRS